MKDILLLEQPTDLHLLITRCKVWMLDPKISLKKVLRTLPKCQRKAVNFWYFGLVRNQSLTVVSVIFSVIFG